MRAPEARMLRVLTERLWPDPRVRHHPDRAIRPIRRSGWSHHRPGLGFGLGLGPRLDLGGGCGPRVAAGLGGGDAAAEEQRDERDHGEDGERLTQTDEAGIGVLVDDRLGRLPVDAGVVERLLDRKSVV